MQPQMKTPKAGGPWALREIFSRQLNTEQALAESIMAGCGASVQVVADGDIHRVDHPDKGRGNKRCWYVCHADYGIWGDWATAEQHVVYPQGERDPETARRARLEADQRKRDRQAEKERGYALVARQCRQEWPTLPAADPAQAYLVKKSIKPIGLRQRGNLLVVPLYLDAGLTNFQTIAPSGEKRFLPDGRKKGCYFPIGGLKPSEPLLICEGVATGITLHMATGYAVACAMDCGNLLPVAKSLRARHPGIAIIVCADNDWHQPGNPGIASGKAAAAAVGGRCIWPALDGVEGASDYNDLASLGSEVTL